MESNIAQGKERVIKQTGIAGMHLTSGYTLIDHEGDECNHTRTSPRGAQSMAKPRSREASIDIRNRSKQTDTCVRTYVLHMLGTYITILCNWLIL